MSPSPFVSVEDRGRIRWMTLDRPERKNAVPLSGWAGMSAAFAEFAESDRRVLVLRGAGDDFCAGADLAEGDIGSGTAEHMQFMGRPAAAALALHRLAKPTVAAVDGVAYGAGMNLALGCDVVVASDRVRFCEVFVRRGLTLDFGGTWLLPRLVGAARARELALSGREVDADEALAIGLVAAVVAPDALERRAAETAEALAAGAPVAQRFIKVGLDRSSSMTFEQALEYESQAQAILLGSEDFAEGVTAFRERRRPRFLGL